MPPSLSCDQSGAKMCCCCGVKLPKEQLISPKVELMVKMFGPNPSYSSTVASYPTGLCSSCNHALYKSIRQVNLRPPGVVLTLHPRQTFCLIVYME